MSGHQGDGPDGKVGRSVPPVGMGAAALSDGLRSWPLVVLVIALSVRLWGIDWQLPAALYFDEMKYVAWAGDAKDDATAAVTDLRNPTFFHHLLQAEYAVAALVRGRSRDQDTAVFELLLARQTSAVLGALACLLTGLAARTVVLAIGGLRGPSPAEALAEVSTGAAGGDSGTADDAAWAGLAAGLILALAPLHVHLSHYAVNDASASLFLAATLLFGARALAHGHRRDLLLAGLMAGLSFSTKYSFGVGLLLPALAAAFVVLGRPHIARDGASGWRAALVGRGWQLLLVGGGFLVGMVAGAPEFVVTTSAVLEGIADQSRLGGVRWNGQSEDPVWQLYAETLVQGMGWPALAVAAFGVAALAVRRPLVLVVMAAVPLAYLAVMLRQELFFARFALPLLPSLAMLAGIGTIALARFGVRGSQSRSAWVVTLALLLLVLQLLPATATTVRHNQLAVTPDTRVLARRWLERNGDGARVATEVYGQPLAWAGNDATRGYRLQRVRSFVDLATVGRLTCDGTRFFLVASLTAERELARRGSKAKPSGYEALERTGRVVVTFDPFRPGYAVPAHPDNTGIPFWYLEAYARPGPKIVVYEMARETFRCQDGDDES